MKRSSIWFCSLFIISFLLLSPEARAGNPLVGEWTFSVTQAPWEYSRGKVLIDLDEEQAPVGKIVFDSGIEVRIAKITQEENKVTMEIYVEGYPVRTILDLEDDEMKGYTETPEGSIPFAAKRYIPEE